LFKLHVRLLDIEEEHSADQNRIHFSYFRQWLREILSMIDFTLLFYFAFWYLGNYYYNIQNKNAAIAAGGEHYAMTLATGQLVVGVMYATFLWLAPDARKLPNITFSDFMAMIPAGVCTAGAHAASVFSLAAGGVAFGQIVKAAEPAFAAVVGTFIYGKKISLAKWVCLIPIIGGVCLAALKQNADGTIELDFTIGGLVGALIANLFAAFKGAESHKLMSTPGLKERLGSVGNQFALMMIISLIVTVPIALATDYHKFESFMHLYNTKPELSQNLILAGLTFYGYNELATMTLTRISPVTNSVANTAKRVVVIVGSAIVFNESISGLKAIGCTVCILGVFLNSIIDDILAPKKAPKVAEKQH
jgi:solute carrier family 35, member E1